MEYFEEWYSFTIGVNLCLFMVLRGTYNSFREVMIKGHGITINLIVLQKSQKDIEDMMLEGS